MGCLLKNNPSQFRTRTIRFLELPYIRLVTYSQWVVWFFVAALYCVTACNAMHGIAIAILSVRLSVCLSDACIVTRLNDALRIF